MSERKKRASHSKAMRRFEKLYAEAQRLQTYTERAFFDGIYVKSAEFYGYEIDRSSPGFAEYSRRVAGMWWRYWQAEKILNDAMTGCLSRKREQEYRRNYHNRRHLLAEHCGIEIPKGPFKKKLSKPRIDSRNEHMRHARRAFGCAHFDPYVLNLLKAAGKFAPLTKSQQAEAAAMRAEIAARAKQQAA